MSRNGSMSVLDSLEGLMAQYVIDFKEDIIHRNVTLNGCDCVEWQKCRLVYKFPLPSLFDGRAVLKEEDVNASLKKITISDVDSESLLLHPDNFGIRYFTRGSFGKASDYLLFTRYKSKHYAIFIELKSKIYEKQNGDTCFQFTKPKDKAIVWQMIGADALLDSFVNVLTKYKKSEVNREFAKFKRRYIVLYQNIDETGFPQPSTLMLPNINALKKPIHALKVSNNQEFGLSHLFFEGGLEE